TVEGRLPHFPWRVPRVVDVGQLLLLLERVHAPASMVLIGNELTLGDETREGFQDELFTGLDVLEDLRPENKEPRVDEQVRVGDRAQRGDISTRLEVDQMEA